MPGTVSIGPATASGAVTATAQQHSASDAKRRANRLKL
jgi:hypothetical protein